MLFEVSPSLNVGLLLLVTRGPKVMGNIIIIIIIIIF